MYLAHHGVKGQKWGVRRYQNIDGTWTEEGRRRRREVVRTDAINSIYDSMTDKEKYYLTSQRDSKSYASAEERSTYVVQSFLEKNGNQPIGFLDIWQSGDQQGSIAIGVNANNRGGGVGKRLVEKGLEWFENNPSMTELVWSAHSDNIASNALAKEYGFEETNSSDVDWKIYRKRK